jgi:hypothetical protein
VRWGGELTCLGVPVKRGHVERRLPRAVHLLNQRARGVACVSAEGSGGRAWAGVRGCDGARYPTILICAAAAVALCWKKAWMMWWWPCAAASWHAVLPV